MEQLELEYALDAFRFLVKNQAATRVALVYENEKLDLKYVPMAPVEYVVVDFQVAPIETP